MQMHTSPGGNYLKAKQKPLLKDLGMEHPSSCFIWSQIHCRNQMQIMCSTTELGLVHKKKVGRNVKL